MAEPPSGTVTFFFTDIEGSTARWERHPEAMRAALARHDALVRAAIQEHGGHIFKTVGDAFCAALMRAPDAVAAALESQRRLHAESWGEIGPLRVRMALHSGAAEERDGDYFGPPLSRVGRLLSARPNNLPIAPASLVGREREVAAACERLLQADVRLLTLTGTGGTGNTRLSLDVAAELIDQSTTW